MLIRKGHKFRLKVKRERVRTALAQAGGCSRFVWNRALGFQKERLDNKEKLLSYSEMARRLVLWKKEEETSFLQDVPSQPLQQTLMQLDRALRDSLSKKSNKRFPRFKRKYRGDTFVCPQGVKVEGNKVFLPKIGWVKFWKSQEIVGTIKNVTISQKGQDWFISFQTEQEVPEPCHSSTSIVGIDVGIIRFATLSNGEFYLPLNSFKKLEDKLAKEQRKLSLKQKGSNNWKKQKAKVASIHRKIANARLDYLHKLSTEICKTCAIVCIEDLKVSQMTSATGDTGNTKGKTQLNKSILDQGWGEFKRLLHYKLKWNGGQLVLVDPRNTSRTCPICGYISKDNRKSQSKFHCLSCEHQENADLVAAKNILALGHSVLACKPHVA